MKHVVYTVSIQPGPQGMGSTSTVQCRRCEKQWDVSQLGMPPSYLLTEECPKGDDTAKLA
jgi:hypothetical protein